jgi:hypothetical protein
MRVLAVSIGKAHASATQAAEPLNAKILTSKALLEGVLLLVVVWGPLVAAPVAILGILCHGSAVGVGEGNKGEATAWEAYVGKVVGVAAVAVAIKASAASAVALLVPSL